MALFNSVINKVRNAINLGNVFQLKTSVTQELLVVLKDWILYGGQGGMVLGWPRLGKSCGIRWALKSLLKELGFKIWFARVIVRPGAKQDADVFFRHILQKIGHRQWD